MSPPITIIPMQIPSPGDIAHLVDHLSSLPVTAEDISRWTARDPVLSRVYNLIRHGWFQSLVGKEFQSYQNRKDELSVVDGCLLWG